MRCRACRGPKRPLPPVPGWLDEVRDYAGAACSIVCLARLSMRSNPMEATEQQKRAALKAASKAAGEYVTHLMFEAWSASSRKNVPATTAEAWASFRPARIGAGTVYGHALERGWIPDGDLVLNGALAEAAPAGEHPAAAFLAGVEARCAS